MISFNKFNFKIGSFKKVISYITNQKNSHTKIILPCSLNDLVQGEHNQAYKAIDICTTDGMPLVWWLSLKYRKRIERVYGPNLMKFILKKTKIKNLSMVFLGAEKQTLSELKKIVNKKNKNHFLLLKKLASSNKEQQVLNRIIDIQPNILWIGIGSPKQIELAAKLKIKLNKTTIFCVGAAFDFITHQKPSAPSWIKKMGLEWLFRLISEPHRLWKRYLIAIPCFLLKIFFNWCKKKSKSLKNKIFLSLLSIVLTVLIASVVANSIIKKNTDPLTTHWTVDFTTYSPKYVFWENFSCKNYKECPIRLRKKESLLTLPIREYNHSANFDERLSLLFLGDSFSTAPFVKEGFFDHFSKRLSLVYSNKYIESMILASGASGTGQQLAKFSDLVLDLKPDVVMWQFCWNDFTNNIQYPLYKLANERLHREKAWNNAIFWVGFLNQNIPFLKNSSLGNFIMYEFFRYENSNYWPTRFGVADDSILYNEKFISASISEMKKLSKKHEFEFYVTLAPLECQYIEKQNCEHEIELYQDELRKILKKSDRFVSMEEYNIESSYQSNLKTELDKALFFYDQDLSDVGTKHLSEKGEKYFGEILFSNFNKLTNEKTE